MDMELDMYDDPLEIAQAENLANQQRKQARKYHTFSLAGNTFEVDVRYTNLKPVGGGSYGLVCSAKDTLTGKPVAIKKITDTFQDLIDAKRIMREIKLLMMLGAMKISLASLISWYACINSRFQGRVYCMS